MVTLGVARTPAKQPPMSHNFPFTTAEAAPLPRPVLDCSAAILDTELYIVGQGGFLRYHNGEWTDVAGAKPIKNTACESVLLG